MNFFALKKFALVPLIGVTVALSWQLDVFAQTHQWIRVTTDNDDNAYYLDKAIAGRGQFRRYWMKIVFADNDRDTKSRKSLYSIDCKNKQRRLRMYVEYDKNNKMTYSNRYGGDGYLDKVTPQHSPVNFRLANIVCSTK
ncbi:MAG: surface-adhesin E family protein [Crinalium sp.]